MARRVTQWAKWFATLVRNGLFAGLNRCHRELVDMILTALIFGLIFGGCLAWFVEGRSAGSAKYVCAIFLIAALFGVYTALEGGELAHQQLTEVVSIVWISDFNIYFTLGSDYLSSILILLTLFLAGIALMVSWREMSGNQASGGSEQRVGFYYANIMFATAGIVGVFSAIDMFLLFCDFVLITMIVV